MKTAQRILLTATRLFNEQGERNVTANDIALELDISSGNLYYHFKGKDGILSALFADYYRELASLLAAPLIDDSFLDQNAPASPCAPIFKSIVKSFSNSIKQLWCF